MKECLVIGYGSIGKRHATVLKNLGCQVSIVTAQKIDDFICYENIQQALANKKIEYIVIANPTHLHFQSIMELIACHYQGILLIEKPLFAKVEKLPPNNIAKILVAYNLRFHQLLQQAKELIAHEKLITFSAYVGQYLPTWRKGTDYRYSYSAKKDCGGGVLRDLSHELDYTIWFCGPCIDITSMGGRFSHLEISSEDVFSIIMKCSNCPIVNIHLNYLDRTPRREIIINTTQKTLKIDLIKATLCIDGEVISECIDAVNQSYFQQHQAILNNEFHNFSQYADGMYIMEIIESIEAAATARTWMTL